MSITSVKFAREVIDENPLGRQNDVTLIFDVDGDGFNDVVIGGFKGENNIVWYHYPNWERHVIGTASLIWATTTPVRKSGNLSQLNEERTARVKERNRIAVAFMKEHSISVNDLYALVERRPEFYGNDGTHFNNEGIAVQGKQVAEMVLQYLPNQEAK